MIRKGKGIKKPLEQARIYAGDAFGCDTRKLRVLSHRTSLAAQGGGDEDIKRLDRDRTQYGSKVLEGLIGEAFRIAEDRAIDVPIHPGGVPKLVSAIEEFTNQKKDQEAKELFREGSEKY